MKKDLIRNFSIIAHIDHGKSTLADRIMEFTNAISKREFRNQILDDMDLEKERGITIKASAVRIEYKAKNGKTYCLNLIDTPGHVDFTYEVSKSTAACEGALLLVDASQGVEAQTVANLYLAMEHNLTIIPVINKIDLASADVDKVKKQIEGILGLKKDDILLASAKEGRGTEDILEKIVEKIPSPRGDASNPLQALIFDSRFDIYKGAVLFVRLVNGVVKKGMHVKTMNSGKVYEVKEVGVFKPKPSEIGTLACGEVGYISCSIRDAREVIIGDTVTDSKNPAASALPGYRKVTPMVYCGIYPVTPKDFPALKDAVAKMKLQDASFIFEPESSTALGMGFRCGFLGLLHMEIIQERLEREYDLNLVITTPSVIYEVKLKNGDILKVDNPAKFPKPDLLEWTREPFAHVFIIVPKESIGDVMKLAESRRAVYSSTEFLDEERVKLVYEMPIAEIITDFYDIIKSLTKGYGSLDYEMIDYRPAEVVKLNILINGDIVDALSLLVNKEKVHFKGRSIVKKLKETIPRHLFKIAVQAAIGGKIIAREDISALGKHVTGKCYGGDITRKRKLWEKQKAGKKRMKQFGKIQIPQEAFFAALKA
ncbi:MAG: translation elongation factor 4 [Omnitrophica bacterium]|nr:translation elongation factor 4 [Candidatus Omnitrophota bacterium]